MMISIEVLLQLLQLLKLNVMQLKLSNLLKIRSLNFLANSGKQQNLTHQTILRCSYKDKTRLWKMPSHSENRLEMKWRSGVRLGKQSLIEKEIQQQLTLKQMKLTISKKPRLIFLPKSWKKHNKRLETLKLRLMKPDLVVELALMTRMLPTK